MRPCSKQKRRGKEDDMSGRADKKDKDNQIQSGLESFITRYYADILRYCRWHVPVRSLAEDATQETFLKLIRYYGEVFAENENTKRHAQKEEFRHLRPLLYRIAAYTCIDLCRKKSMSEQSLDALYEQSFYGAGAGNVSSGRRDSDGMDGQQKNDGSPAGMGIQAEPGYERVLSNMELQRMVACLPESQREIVLLRFAQDLTLREIAAVVDLPLRTVQSRLRAALKYLKKKLAKERNLREGEEK